jgi:hypothetical protein
MWHLSAPSDQPASIPCPLLSQGHLKKERQLEKQLREQNGNFFVLLHTTLKQCVSGESLGGDDGY